MQFPNNDLWSVRQIEFLADALKGYENSKATYYPNNAFSLEIPEIASYKYIGALYFDGQDRTVIFEQGEGFGLKREEIINYLNSLNIQVDVKE